MKMMKIRKESVRHMFKKNIERMFALGLTGILVSTGVTGCGNTRAETTESEYAVQDTEKNDSAAAGHGSEDGKTEMVYAIADASGTVSKTIVSSWLSNPSEADTILDTSTLMDIINTKGDEEYTIDADGNLVWNAGGNDIYYQGTTDEELPVAVSITYYLDDAEISPEELAGKSGSLRIEFHYTNNLSETTEIDGEEVTIYQPFACVSGLLLDNEVASNVTVTNGKAINDGEHTVVVGMAFPGLSESLGLDDLTIDGEAVDIEIPEEVIITADVTDFSMMTTITVEDNSILKSFLGSDDTYDAESLTDTMDEMTDASAQLVSGTSDLYDGVCTLYDGAVSLQDGAKQLDDGAGSLVDGTGKIVDGSDSLYEGTQTLSDGTATLLDGTEKLADGANTLSTGAASLSAGADALESGAGELSEGLNTIEEGAGTLDNGLASLNESVAVLPDSTETLYQGALSLKLGLKSGNTSDQSKYGIYEAAYAIKSGSATIQAGLVSQDASNPGIYEGASVIAEGAASIEAGAETISSSLVSGDTSNPGIYEGAVSIATGAKSGSSENPGIYEAAGLVSSGLSTAATSLDAAAQYDQTAYNAVLALVQNGTLSAEDAKPILTAIETSRQYDAAVSENLTGTSMTTALTGIQTGAATINSAATTIAGGAKQLAAGADSIASGASSIESGAESLSAGASKLSQGMTSVATAADGIMNGVDTMISGNNGSNLNAMIDGLSQLNAGSTTLVDGVLQLKVGSAKLLSGITSASDGADSLAAGTTELADGAEQVAAGAVSVADGAGQLESGSTSLKEGAEQLSDGAKSLSEGTEELADGAKTLKDGTKQLADGTDDLVDGVETLKDGAKELADGMKQFDEEAIGKLANILNEDLGGISDRMKAVMDFADTYHSFTGSNEDSDTGVKFILRTEGISKDEEESKE